MSDPALRVVFKHKCMYLHCPKYRYYYLYSNQTTPACRCNAYKKSSSLAQWSDPALRVVFKHKYIYLYCPKYRYQYQHVYHYLTTPVCIYNTYNSHSSSPVVWPLLMWTKTSGRKTRPLLHSGGSGQPASRASERQHLVCNSITAHSLTPVWVCYLLLAALPCPVLSVYVARQGPYRRSAELGGCETAKISI